jgi:hypothetical protein
MSKSAPDSQPGVEHRRSVPTSTWIGLGAAAFVGGIGAMSGGFWSMALMLALYVLGTATYGLIFRRTTWLRLPRKRAAAALGVVAALVVLLGSASAYGATHPTSPTGPVGVTSPSPTATHAHDTKKTNAVAPRKTRTPTPTPTPTPVVTTKTVAETTAIPFPTTTVTSSALPKGKSSITTAGANGVETKTYVVTYTNGVETARALKSDVVTRKPVAQVTTVGTYVPPAAPACTNGTYVNSRGNTVCRPEVSSSAPSGATARCRDGSYGFSQSRRGTCSSHGGVAEWL